EAIAAHADHDGSRLPRRPAVSAARDGRRPGAVGAQPARARSAARQGARRGLSRRTGRRRARAAPARRDEAAGVSGIRALEIAMTAGIDLTDGTVRAVAVDADGRILARAEQVTGDRDAAAAVKEALTAFRALGEGGP